MPLYEYACSTCRLEFDELRKHSEPAPPCPSCDGQADKKVSLAAFHLKGGGWFADAYAGPGNKKGKG